MAVLSQLDPFDLLEAQFVRGAPVTHLALFADWRAMRCAWIASYILTTGRDGRRPFAVLAVGHTGQAGVAQAAFLARDHVRHRLAIGRAAVLIRDGLPPFMDAHGIARIEARCWADHPTAPGFLTRVGFKFEARLPGFGGALASTTFLQFALVAPIPAAAAANPEETLKCA